ncbi:hypothetical protein [Nocardioides stalactiti]|nr:hypothetical protein [Nocardioides stalactiti]
MGLPTVIDLVSVSPGSHTVTLACRESPSDVQFEDLRIGVLELAGD